MIDVRTQIINVVHRRIILNRSVLKPNSLLYREIESILSDDFEMIYVTAISEVGYESKLYYLHKNTKDIIS